MDKHWVWLTTRKGVGTNGCARLLRLFGSAERVYECTKREYLQTEGFEERWLESLCDKDLTGAEDILRRCDEHDICLLRYDDDAYPDRLRSISDPPALLYYRGKLPDFDNEAAVAVVGSRRCSAYGLLHAKQFARLMALSGGVVLSGGARGIDTMALRGALDSAMPVVCVCGCGLDIAYPRENRFLFTEISRHGCLISEYPPGTPPLPAHFPVRNRILSGLSLGVLVVEAPEKSGALITAEHALEQGRDVFAIPGNLGAKHCEGSNRLLREGAILAQDGWDVMREYEARFPDKLMDGRRREALSRVYRARYGKALPVYSPVSFGDGESAPAAAAEPPAYEPEPAVPAAPAKQAAPVATPALAGDEKTVFDALGTEPLLPDELVVACGLPAQRVLTALTMLQIKKLAAKTAGNRFFRVG